MYSSSSTCFSVLFDGPNIQHSVVYKGILLRICKYTDISTVHNLSMPPEYVKCQSYVFSLLHNIIHCRKILKHICGGNYPCCHGIRYGFATSSYYTGDHLNNHTDLMFSLCSTFTPSIHLKTYCLASNVPEFSRNSSTMITSIKWITTDITL